MPDGVAMSCGLQRWVGSGQPSNALEGPRWVVLLWWQHCHSRLASAVDDSATVATRGAPAWMGKAVPQHDSVALGVEQALKSAFCVSTVATSSIPGDIPSLLRHAYSRHFNKVLPVELDAEITNASTSSAELESLQNMLSRNLSLKPTAQVFLDRARSFLADGPPLSMNVELAEGQELPVALHTLLQGTLWAVMMASGANPDLEDRVLEKAVEEYPYDCDIHDKIRQRLTPEAKSLWFLCRKFFFTLNVAERNGLDKSYSLGNTTHRHLRYQGRLFTSETSNRKGRLVPAIHEEQFVWIRVPPCLTMHTVAGEANMALTPRGIYVWGDKDYACVLGVGNEEGKDEEEHEHVDSYSLSELFDEGEGCSDTDSDESYVWDATTTLISPTRLTFPECHDVAEYEASLPPWHKDRLAIKLTMGFARTFIQTPLGLLIAGSDADKFNGGLSGAQFRHVPLPEGFVPDHIHASSPLALLTMGDRQLIGGSNHCGPLGIGTTEDTVRFTEIQFKVDSVIYSSLRFTLFWSGNRILFAGEVQRGLLDYLPGLNSSDLCTTATPLSVVDGTEHLIAASFSFDEYNRG